MEKINDDKCIVCGKKVKKMKAPYEDNYIGGVDVLLYAHYGSKHTPHTFPKTSDMSLGVKPKWGVICDECYEKNISN
tara:strand:- start:1045 stop:1275 length:231 start_codon:yes stop_codon:yes gene_type:complete